MTCTSVRISDLGGIVSHSGGAMPQIVQCSCGAKLRAYDQHAGQVIDCPRCGRSVRIPTEGSLDTAPPMFSDAELNEPFRAIQDDDDGQGTSRLPLITGAVGFVSGVLVTLLSVYLLVDAKPGKAGDQTVANSSAPNVSPPTSPALPPAQNGAVSHPNREPVAPAAIVGKPAGKQVQVDAPQVGQVNRNDPAVPQLQFPGMKQFSHPFEVASEEDRFAGYTSHSVRSEGPGAVLRLTVFFLVHEDGSSPESLTFSFSSQTETWKYLKYHPVGILADGKRLSLGKPDHDGDVLRGGNGVLEHISVKVNLKEFLQIVWAQRVEVKVGETELVLSPEQLEALRDLSSRLPSGETATGRYLVTHEEVQN